MNNLFIFDVYSKARKSETLDINNKKKSFFKRNCRYIVAIPCAIFVSFTLPTGYGADFLELIASVLAILIGLFLTSLVFALDKFYAPSKSQKGDYKLELNENDQVRKIDISIDEIQYNNAREKLWQKRSLYYVQKFNVLVGKSVIVGIWSLILVCINSMYYDFLKENITNYSIGSVTFQSFVVFLKLSFIFVLRFLICSFMIEIFYNTIRIISSMVNFMSVKISK